MFDSTLTSFFTILSMVLIAVTHISMALLLKVLWSATKSSTLSTPRIQERFGTLFFKLTLKNKVSVYWNILVLFRWTVTLMIVVYLRDYYSF